MARISQKTIDQVIASADIVDVISRYLEINRNNKALCPFHNDNKPSLSIKPESQIFNCFTCETKGGSITFIMLKENITYPQAIETLANMYNIVIEYDNKQYQQNYDDKSQIIEVYNIAKEIYHNNLYSNIGSDCLNYIKNRGINDEMIKEFKLGYCPINNNSLHKKVVGKYSAKILENSRLFNYNGKEYVDFFGGRFVVPILDRNNNTIAFNGRALKEDQNKYKNSFDSIIYKKGNTLYGLNKTKDHIKQKKSVIVVEGPTDFIALFQNNVKNVVASGGTAFTENQIKTLKMITKNIYINFDTDSKFSGQNAAIKVGYTLFKNGIEPKIVSFPIVSDPDDYIKLKGIDEYLKCLKKSRKLFDFHYEIYQAINKDDASPQGFVDEIKKEISSINDPIYREIAIQNLSTVINVNSNSILTVINKIIDEKNNYDKIRNQIKNNTKNQNKMINVIKKKNLLEDDFIRICLSQEFSIRKFIYDNVDINWVESTIHKKLYEHIYIHLTSENLPEMNIIINTIVETDVTDKATSIILDIENSLSNINIAKDCLIRLESNYIRKKLNNLRETLKNTTNDPTNDIKNIFKLEKKLKTINSKYI